MTAKKNTTDRGSVHVGGYGLNQLPIALHNATKMTKHGTTTANTGSI